MCCTCYSIGLQSHIHVYCTLWVIEGSSRVIFAVSVNLSHTPMRKDSPAWECSVESPFCSSLLQIHPFCPGVGDSQNLLSESLVLRLLSWIWKYFKTIPTLQSYCFWQTRQAARTPLALDCAGLLVPCSDSGHPHDAPHWVRLTTPVWGLGFHFSYKNFLGLVMAPTNRLWQHLHGIGVVVFLFLFPREKWTSSMLGTGSGSTYVPHGHGLSSSTTRFPFLFSSLPWTWWLAGSICHPCSLVTWPGLCMCVSFYASCYSCSSQAGGRDWSRWRSGRRCSAGNVLIPCQDPCIIHLLFS